MPDALISRITSRGPGVGSGNSLSSSLRSPRNTTPFMAASDACVSNLMRQYIPTGTELVASVDLCYQRSSRPHSASRSRPRPPSCSAPWWSTACSQRPEVFWGFVASMCIGNLMLLFLDLWVLVIFGVFGYALRKLRVDPSPMVVALVLGPMMEKTLRQALFLTRGSVVDLVARAVGDDPDPRRRRALRPTARPASARETGHAAATSLAPAPRSVEGQDGAGDLARLHRAERLVDVVEAAAAGDHLVEQQPALAIEVEVPGNVDAEAVAAHAGGLYPALGTDGHPGELDLRVGRQDPDDRRGAADG